MSENEPRITVIGPETSLQGELTFDRAARIEGRFEGKVVGQGELHVAETAECKAEIQAGSVVIDGVVIGNIHAAEKVQLNGKGKLLGDATSPRISVTDGAVFVGQVNVGDERSSSGISRTGSNGMAAEADTPVPARK